ncbi:hypothetical protein E0E54_03480 [Azotobacter chroococcum]|uniref:hypothetical protein n=1 Tax=Azotobacter chroococcum TaxID=353 RepID=UPI001038D089|nr:hypothetical protein [Azotobacter chroococcum]TBW39141.1 hypothetical protein E0E54_03480 [Azotobacter chroococcum]
MRRRPGTIPGSLRHASEPAFQGLALAHWRTGQGSELIRDTSAVAANRSQLSSAGRRAQLIRIGELLVNKRRTPPASGRTPVNGAGYDAPRDACAAVAGNL